MSLLPINRQPSPSQLKVFAFAWLLFFGTIATTLAVRGRVPAAMGVGTLAFIVPAIGLVKPSILRGAFLTLSYLTWPIGWVVSHVILAIVYYAVLTPIALLLRLFKYDPLTRRMDRGASTYWKPVSTSPIERYFRQH
jgi:hypothetical protein